MVVGKSKGLLNVDSLNDSSIQFLCLLAKILSTDRDAPMLVVGGFTYHNNMVGSVKVLWRCTVKGCKGGTIHK